MKKGLVRKLDELEFRCYITPERMRDYGITRHSAVLFSGNTISEFFISQNVLIEIRSWKHYDYNSYQFQITSFRVKLFNRIFQYNINNYFGNYGVHLHIINPRWYITEDLVWKFVADDAIVKNHLGQNLYSFGYIEEYFSHLSPSGFPVIGYPPILYSNIDFPAYFGIGNIFDEIWDDNLQNIKFAGAKQTTATGGWRIKENNQYFAFPVNLNVFTPNQNPNCCVLPYEIPSIIAHDTYNCSVRVYHRNRRHVTTSCLGEEKRYFSAIMCLPNLKKEYVRLCDNQSVAVHRMKFPKCTKTDYNRCVFETPIDGLCDNEYFENIEIISEKPENIDVIFDEKSIFEEEVLDANIYAPVYWRFDWWQTVASESQLTENNNSTIPSICAFGVYKGRFVVQNFPRISQVEVIPAYRIDAININIPNVYLPYSYGYYLMREWINYVNTWCNPFWMYFLYFSDWSLGIPLQSVQKEDYWLLYQQQWLGDNNIEFSKRSKRRNTCYLEPLNTTTPYKDFIRDYLTGYRTLWVGVNNFEIDYFSKINEKQCNQSSQSLFSAIGATLVFNTENIQINPESQNVTIDFEMSSFDTYPYFYPSLSDEVEIKIISGSYLSIDVYVVNFENQEKKLDNPINDIYKIKRFNDVVYAGTWKQNFNGNLFLYDEQPYDLLTEGKSTVLMNNNKNRIVYHLLGSQNPAKIRIKISGVSGTLIMQYPKFIRKYNNHSSYCIPTTHNMQTCITRSRIFNFSLVNFSVSNPNPTQRFSHQHSEVYDFYCLDNILFRGESFQNNIWSRVKFDFEETENSYLELKRNSKSFAYCLKNIINNEPIILLINAIREIPQLLCVPKRKRKKEDLSFDEDSEYGCYHYLFSTYERYYTNSGKYINIYKIDGNTKTKITNEKFSVQNYYVSSQAIGLENSEVIRRWNGTEVNSPIYVVSDGEKDYAKVTLFHGYSSIINIEDVSEETNYVVYKCWQDINENDKIYLLGYDIQNQEYVYGHYNIKTREIILLPKPERSIDFTFINNQSYLEYVDEIGTNATENRYEYRLIYNNQEIKRIKIKGRRPSVIFDFDKIIIASRDDRYGGHFVQYFDNILSDIRGDANLIIANLSDIDNLPYPYAEAISVLDKREKIYVHAYHWFNPITNKKNVGISFFNTSDGYYIPEFENHILYFSDVFSNQSISYSHPYISELNDGIIVWATGSDNKVYGIKISHNYRAGMSYEKMIISVVDELLEYHTPCVYTTMHSGIMFVNTTNGIKVINLDENMQKI